MSTQQIPPIELPTATSVNLSPPTATEVDDIADGIAAVIGPLQPIQSTLLGAVIDSMTGHRPTMTNGGDAIARFGASLAARDHAFRTRIVQQMILGALVIRPLDPQVVARIRDASIALQVDDTMIDVAADVAAGQFDLAAMDVDRNGYTAGWSDERAAALHASRSIDTPWQDASADDELAERWRQLEQLPDGTLGNAVTRFYRARGFVYPGRPGSVSPLLAQHDWVHVLADFGSTIDNELEVFAFIARSNDDPRGFSFLAMVVSLFETGAMSSGVGLFVPDEGHLQRPGMPERVGDAMRRGAECNGSVDWLSLDWFELADQPIDDVRAHFGLGPKAPGLGSPGPFQAGGMTTFQVDAGGAAAAAAGVDYDTWGAGPE
jgi:hypothetical protein